MILHFQYQSLYNQKLPGWHISFYYRGKKYEAIYHHNGQIEWETAVPEKEEEIKKHIHELMLFHVYDGS
jgi:hypothetical protein